MKQTIRLIACDMDGTLLGGDKRISAGNASALADAQAAGIRLCVATGRHPEDVTRFFQDIDIQYDCIGLNGAVVLQRGHAEKISPLSADDVRTVFNAIRGGNVAWIAITRNGAHTCKSSALSALRAVEPITEQEAVQREIFKILCVTDGDLAALAAAREAVERTGLAVSSSWSDNFEVNATGVGKDTALAALCGNLGIARQEVMAIGDYENDRGMLAWAGASVAMGNALPQIAALAKYKTKTNLQDGVAYAIRRWAL